MARLLMQAGILIWPILLLCLVIAGSVLRNLFALARRGESPARRRHSIDAVLFWGCLAAVLGFLGQWVAMHKICQAIAARGVVNPTMVAIGISESLTTPIAGMAVLVAAACAWFLLRLGLWSVERRANP